MLISRQRSALALLGALGGEVGALDFQKLLFLYCAELGEEAPYDFVPYRFGAFSFTSYADKRKLATRGYLDEHETMWKLTPSGWRAISAKADARGAADFVRRCGRSRGSSLVADVYRRFPYFATRSEIASEVLRGDEAALRAIEESRPARAAPGLCTIGYEGSSLEGYLNRLLRGGVTLLCDVRRNALSRKYGFSRSTLSNASASLGLRYEHLPELGIESSERRTLQSEDDYHALFSRYRAETLPKQTRALEMILAWIAEGATVALTCFEATSTACHRGCVAAELERMAGNRLAAVHL